MLLPSSHNLSTPVYMKPPIVQNARKALVVFLIFSTLLTDCSWDNVPLHSNGSDGVKDSVCYLSEIEPIINTNCAMPGCHDATSQEEGVDLSSYWGVLEIVKPGSPENSKLIEVITSGGEELMPPSPNQPLSADQIALIEAWIREGAGYNIDCNVNQPCDTLDITYSTSIRLIIDNHCIGCHDVPSTGGGILLNSWAEVADQSLHGNLLCSVYHDPHCSPMPKNAAQLSDCDLKKISIWVDSGAPNN